MHWLFDDIMVNHIHVQSQFSTMHSYHNDMLNLKANNLHFCQSQDGGVGWQLDCYSLAYQ